MSLRSRHSLQFYKLVTQPFRAVDMPEAEAHGATVIVPTGGFTIHHLNAFVFIRDLFVGVSGEESHDTVFLTKI